MNSKLEISIGCMNSCGMMKGLDSSALKVFVRGQNIHIWVMGSYLRRMPWRLVLLMQYVKLRKNGDVYFDLIN